MATPLDRMVAEAEETFARLFPQGFISTRDGTACIVLLDKDREAALALVPLFCAAMVNQADATITVLYGAGRDVQICDIAGDPLSRSAEEAVFTLMNGEGRIYLRTEDGMFNDYGCHSSQAKFCQGKFAASYLLTVMSRVTSGELA